MMWRGGLSNEKDTACLRGRIFPCTYTFTIPTDIIRAPSQLIMLLCRWECQIIILYSQLPKFQATIPASLLSCIWRDLSVSTWSSPTFPPSWLSSSPGCPFGWTWTRSLAEQHSAWRLFLLFRASHPVWYKCGQKHHWNMFSIWNIKLQTSRLRCLSSLTSRWMKY